MPWNLALELHLSFRILLFNKAGKPESGRLGKDLQQMETGSSLPLGIASKNTIVYKKLTRTSNGEGHANGDVPASGRTPLSTLDEVVASFTVSDSGKLSLSDYFEPYEYITMDAGDRDLGSGGVTLLDPDVFKGAGVSRIGLSMGKNGKA